MRSSIMNQPKKVYISLGSNQGEKFKYLQQAIDLIYQKIGNIKSLSKVYTSPALGFEGDTFFNACICVETDFTPRKLLTELLTIEKKIGRIRTKTKGYESRVIDLDIIFFEDQIVDTKTLKLPHPEMHNRKFVLLPLQDIASEFKHPIKNSCRAFRTMQR